MKLLQKGFLKGSQTFEIIDNDIHVTFRQGRQIREFKVPLNVISKNSAICKAADYKFLILSSITSIFAVLFIVLGITSERTEPTAFLSVLMVIFSYVTYQFHKKRNYDYLIYYNIFSGQPALVFWRDNPDKKIFSEFIGHLNNRLAEQKNQYIQQESGMSGEIHKLYELWQKGIISEEEFKAGKSKVLGAEGEDWKF